MEYDQRNHTFLCSALLCSWQARIALSPVYSPCAPLQCRKNNVSQKQWNINIKEYVKSACLHSFTPNSENELQKDKRITSVMEELRASIHTQLLRFRAVHLSWQTLNCVTTKSISGLQSLYNTLNSTTNLQVPVRLETHCIKASYLT